MSAEPPSDPNAEPNSRRQRLAAAMAAFLAFRAGGGDAAAFLREHEDLRDLLEPMLAVDAADDGGDDPHATGDAAVLAPGSTLDDYRIVRLVGRGGMGAVYEAEQRSLRRRVALKVLHEHLAWSPGAIARFRREAAAASRLRHPGLVPIHEVGEWRGRHWFSMEFVDGVPLAERVHDARFGVRADVSRAAEAAELVARIADALQHAHEQGLVHRDVKPHNVMLSADGTVRLLDFGLAAATDGSSEQTVTGTFLGTPHYCSPEQIAGRRVGPAADVFALGVVLYELLARQRPFDGETARVVLLKIEEGRFAPLRQRAPDAPRDLETICHKALEPLPQDRYADAGALAADLRRFLRIEPILAVPPSAWTRTTKWVRRQRLRVGLIATSAVLAVGVPLAWIRHVRDADAIDAGQTMLAQVDDLSFQSVEQSLALLKDQLDRQPSPGARHEPRVDEQVRLCEGLLAVSEKQPLRRARVARALWMIGGIYVHLRRAEPALRAAARAREILLADAPRDGASAAVQRQLGLIARLELAARQLAEPTRGDAEFERALALLRPLAERTPAAAEDAVELADLLLLRARNLADRIDRRAEAEPLLREALALASAPAAAARAPVLATRIEAVLGQVLLDLRRHDAALELLRGVVERIGERPEDPALGVDRALAMAGIGQAQQRLGRSADAERSLRAAVESAEGAMQDWPGSAQLRRAMLASRIQLGSLLLVRGRLDAAEEQLRIAARTLPSFPDGGAAAGWMERSLRADLAAQLANCLLLQSSVAEVDVEHARELLDESCALLETLVREQPGWLEFRIDLGAANNSLASLANERREHAVAAPFARRAIEQQQAVLQAVPQHRTARTMLGIHQAHLAYALAHRGDAPGAAEAARGTLANAPREMAALRLAAEAAVRAAQAAADDDLADAAAAHSTLAVEALAAIAAVNAKEARRLLADARFASLRGRDDFAALQARLGGR
jgi:serine/threonine protein kinase